MMQRWTQLILATALSCWLGSAQAAPAVQQHLHFKNAAGQAFGGHLRGDEWLSWVETDNGHVAVRGQSGHYEYARLQNGNLVPSGQAAGPSAHGGGSGLLKVNDPAFRDFVKKRIPPGHAGHNHGPAAAAGKKAAVLGAAGTLEPGQGRDHGPNSWWNTLKAPPAAIPLLVVVLEFNDQQLRSPVSQWHNKVFGTLPGQMNHYFNQVSQNRFQFTPARETEGTANDGFMRVRLPMNHPNHGTAVGTTERFTALSMLDGHIDFASYDTNGDKSLSKEELAIIYLYAGGESATGSSLPSVWAHMTADWGLSRDGVAFNNNYARFGERHFSPPNDNDATFGIIAHELGHSAFGLPDLYDYDGSSSGTGPFCLMSYGSWGAAPSELQGASPSPPSAWIRYRLGFSTINEVSIGTPLNQTLQPVSRNGAITLIPTDQAQEYFLVENRVPEGVDISLTHTGSGGLMIWHIDEARGGNSDDALRLVDFEADDSVFQSYWPFTGKTIFNDTSAPNSRNSQGVNTGVTVRNMVVSSESGRPVTFVAERTIPTRYPSMNFRGTPNAWAASPMKAVAANTWEITQTFAAGVSNPRFKFDVFGNWATNFGDTNRDGILEQGGGDIPAPTVAGAYVIRVNDSTMRYTMTRVNTPPIANAGADQVVQVNQMFTLDGRASSDPDGTTLSYAWSTGEAVAVITNYYTTPGVRIVTLTVTDADGASSSDDVIIDVREAEPNVLPIARIADIPAATVNTPVTLDGTLSSDPDGFLASFSWTITGNGVNTTLGGSRPTFTFTTAGTYNITLTVSDNDGGTHSTSTSLTVSGGGFNKVYPQVLYRGTTNGWAATSPMTLTADNTWSITVTVPASGNHSFKFDIHGNWTLNFGDSNSDGIADQGGGNIALPAGGGNFVIRFNDSTRRYTISPVGGNLPPVAVTAAAQTLVGPTTGSLIGSASYDPDGQIASYKWTQIAGPMVILSNANQANATVNLPAATSSTVYRFRLDVTDNAGASASAEHTITVNPAQSCSSTYNQMHLRGTSNGWGSTVMTRATDCRWEVTATFGSTSTERFKFDVNANWATNFGDSNADGVAEQGGADIKITQGAGTYLIRFNDVNRQYTVTRQ